MQDILLYVLVGIGLTSLILGLLGLRRRGGGLDITPRIEALDDALERVERSVRDSIAESRREAAEAARQQRGESAASMESFRTSMLETISRLSDLQKGQFEAFGGNLTTISTNTAKRLDEFRVVVEERLQSSRNDLTTRLDQSRAELGDEAKKSRTELGATLATLKDGIAQQLHDMRADATTSATKTRTESTESLSRFSRDLLQRVNEEFRKQNERMDGFSTQVKELQRQSEEKADALRKQVEEKLELIRADSTQKLDQMRQTVDEKLQGTLEKRLGESFKQVSDRLEQVHKGLGEMQTLASGVGDLKRVMTNVKTRGTWGEFQLGALLEQLLSPDQFEANVATNPHSSERVEFAIRLPGSNENDSSVVYLPIDAKFPSEDYQRLLDAQDAADVDAVGSASKQLEIAIKTCARAICDKYIAPPATTDFGIMFLPTEGLYAEVVRRTGLVEFCQRDCRVVIAGPTTLAALLNSLQMGFRTLAIQKRSSEVWEVLGAVKTEFGKFAGVLDKVKKKLSEATNTVEDAGRRTRAMDRKLRAVEALPTATATTLLGIEVDGGGDGAAAVEVSDDDASE